MSGRPQDNDRNQEATVYLGNLDEKCTDALLWELMLQAGPVVNVHLPKDRIALSHQGFGFCEFATEEDAEYACKIMNQIKLWGKPIRVNKASYDKKQLDVGANLFIGGLDPLVDENSLFNTFSAFGPVSATAKIARDPQTGESKGYGFISYNDFDASDAAIEAMNGQYLMNKQISAQYAFKKDGKGERHGTGAERLLAAQAKKHQMLPTQGGGAPPFGGPPQQGQGFSGGGYQGAFAGALAPAAPPPNGFPVYQQQQPPQGMPIYNPQQGNFPPAPPMGFPPQNFQQQQQLPQGFPPMGFQQQQPQQFGNMPPPPPPGFGQQGQYGMMPPQQGQFGQMGGMGMGMGMNMGMGMPMMQQTQQNGIPPPAPGFMQQQPPISQR